MSEIILRANAKINLFLEVLAKGSDGYHNIETVFQSIGLHDIVTLQEDRTGNILIQCDNPQVPLDSSNIVYRAAEMLLRESGKSYGVLIKIAKSIPVGAGLAGGSANAAATLLGLNELWGLDYSFDHLLGLGGKLGADVPFCMMGGTALGRGKGNELTRLPALPQIPLIIGNPGFQVSTAWAYKSLSNLGLTRPRKNANILIEKMQQRDISGICEHLYNIFEKVVIPKHLQVLDIKKEFFRWGALTALMTGSGPTVFAFAQDFQRAGYICDLLIKKISFCTVSNTVNNSISKM
jgi:4-diphosphocytidyl-2-C-methyl-D-erythritol kinase